MMRDAGGRGRGIGRVAGMVAVAVAASCGAAIGHAADDRIDDSPSPGGVAREQEGNFADLGANFDANLFGRTGIVLRGGARRRSPVGSDAAPVESRTLAGLRRRGREKLERLERICSLSAPQRARLELAMESDARRLATEIDAVRSRYADARIDFSAPEGQRAWAQFQQDIQLYRPKFQQAFGPGSLFADVLAATLDERQRASFTAETRSLRSFRWRAMVTPVLLQMDEMLGLDRGQHAVIEELLMAAEPRLTVDVMPEPHNTHAEQMLVYLTLSRVAAGPIRRQLSPRQWQAVSMMMNQGKAMQSWLDEQGLIEVER